MVRSFRCSSLEHVFAVLRYLLVSWQFVDEMVDETDGVILAVEMLVSLVVSRTPEAEDFLLA